MSVTESVSSFDGGKSRRRRRRRNRSRGRGGYSGNGANSGTDTESSLPNHRGSLPGRGGIRGGSLPPTATTNTQSVEKVKRENGEQAAAEPPTENGVSDVNANKANHDPKVGSASGQPKNDNRQLPPKQQRSDRGRTNRPNRGPDGDKGKPQQQQMVNGSEK